MRVVMYCARICSYCRMAERLLERKGVRAEKIYVDESSGVRADMMRRTGRTSVPQIFFDDRHVGDYSDLVELDRTGKLDVLLQRAG